VVGTSFGILLANPSDTAAEVTLTFLPDGGARVTSTVPIVVERRTRIPPPRPTSPVRFLRRLP
jgi:hypothetical protein